ncbi:MAG: M3 family oligoendopeptidase [Candidatus Altiarchaeota archaeon]|nr:M3 family oligoendopeptidase [Candidatus Altiarchaeota archaeon]
MRNTWDLDEIINPEGIDGIIRKLSREVDDFLKIREKLDKGPSNEEFMSIITRLEDMNLESMRAAAYCGLKLSENTLDDRRTALETRTSAILSHLGNKTLFFDTWFKELSDKKVKQYIRCSGKYRYMLERKRATMKYQLPENEEKIINLKDLSGQETISRIYDLTVNSFRYNYGGRKQTLSEIVKYRFSTKRGQRKKAYDLVLAKYKEDSSLFSELYRSTVLDWRHECMQIRGYPSSIAVRNIANDVEDQAVKSMLESIEKNSQLFRKYFKMKKKLLNLEKIDKYDLYATPKHKKEQKIPYAKAVKMVLDTYKEFNDRLYELAKLFYESNHINYAPMHGKQSGGFCMSYSKDKKPYVLVNYTGTLEDVFTLIHETGHAIHAMLAADQTQFTYHATLPLSETASVFSEMLLAQKLIRETDDRTRIYSRMLDNQYATVVRQGYITLFELEAHKLISEGASTEDLNTAYLRNLRQHLSPELKVDDVFSTEWMCIPHIFHSPFYCYAYSFGELLVLSLYQRYLADGDFPRKYVEILSLGGSMKPSDIIKKAGLNPNNKKTWDNGFNIIAKEIKSLNPQYK